VYISDTGQKKILVGLLEKYKDSLILCIMGLKIWEVFSLVNSGVGCVLLWYSRGMDIDIGDDDSLNSPPVLKIFTLICLKSSVITVRLYDIASVLMIWFINNSLHTSRVERQQLIFFYRRYKNQTRSSLSNMFFKKERDLSKT
jgi:hypothetical protein